MAVKDFNYMSQALLHPTTVKIVMPDNGNAKRTMYFLHGALSDAKNCLDNTDMQKYADKYNMAVVIPDGGNSFYIDHGAAFGNYGKFAGRELVDVAGAEFGFPKEREDTIIAGFSMGGYGALRNGLKYSKNFGHIIAMSPACIYEPGIYKLNNTRFAYYKKVLFDNVFKEKINPGEFSENYRYLIKNMLKNKKDIPPIYMTCGTKEDISLLTDEFAEFLAEHSVKYEYVKDEGKHDWNLWSRQIEPAIKWCINNR